MSCDRFINVCWRFDLVEIKVERGGGGLKRSRIDFFLFTAAGVRFLRGAVFNLHKEAK